MTDSPTATRHRWRSEIIATFQLAWPIVLTNLGQMLMNMTDVMMLGRLGPETLAASALGSNLYFMLVMPGIGLMTATTPMMARELGARPHSVREIRRVVRHGLWLALFVFLAMFPIWWNGGSLLKAMGQEPALADTAGVFIRLLMWSALPHYGYLVLRSFVSAKERPRAAMIVTFIAVAFNALANWVLIFGHFGFPALGIAGSGLATALSSTLMFALMAGYISLDRRFRRFHLFGRFWRIDWHHFLGLLRLGLPIAALLGLEVGAFTLSALMMGLIDTPTLAAHTIAIQICSVTFMVPLGISQAATVRVGLAYGGGDRRGIDRAGWSAFGLGVGFMVLTATMMAVVPQLLVGAYLDTGDPGNAAVMALAVSFLFWAALFQVADGAQAVLAGMLRGLHDTTWPMVFGLVGYWLIGLPVGSYLAFRTGWRGEGMWIGLTVGLLVVAALLLFRWGRRGRMQVG